MNFLFLLDAPETILVEKDTSFALMEEAGLRGHQVYFLPRGGISFQDEVLFCARKVIVDRKKKNFFSFSKEEFFTAKEVDAVFVRFRASFS